MESIRLFARLAIAACAILAIAGCSAPLPTTELPPTRLVAPALEFPQYRDYRGLVDCRIKSSGMDQAAIADEAKIAQIDFVMLGDRAKPGDTDYGIGGFTSDILFITGAAFDIGGGKIIGVNLRQPIGATASPADLIGAIHDQGGLAIAASPATFRSSNDYALADAVEVYNQSDAWGAIAPNTLWMRAIYRSTDSFLLGLVTWPNPSIAIYDRMAAGARVTMVAGMGAQENFAVMGSKVGTFQQLFLFYTTHILATERNVDPLLDAMKHGRAYISFDVLGYVGQFAFYADSGGIKTIMGDEVRLADGLALKTELSAKADRIVLIENGAEVAHADDTDHLEFAPKTPGTYRIEAYRRTHPWILSNPIYVR